MRFIRAAALLTCLITAIGCRSPYIEATVINHTAQPINLVEVDYPNASFGTQSISPGGSFHYRFQMQGDGDLKLTYTTSTYRIEKATGPSLKEGAEGHISIAIDPDGVHWQFTPGKHV